MNDIDSVMPYENPREYRKALAGLLDAHQPRNEHERMLVQELADANWDWKRARAVDRDHWEYVGTSYNRGTAGVAEALFQVPETRHRPHRNYMMDTERRYYRALYAVERMHRDRERPTSARLRTWTAETLPEAAEPAEQELALPANVVPIDGAPDTETKRSQSDPGSAPPPVRNEAISAAGTEITKRSQSDPGRQTPVQDEANSAPSTETTKRSQSDPGCAPPPARNEAISAAGTETTKRSQSDPGGQTPVQDEANSAQSTETTKRSQSDPAAARTPVQNEASSAPRRPSVPAPRLRRQGSNAKKRNEPISQAAAPLPAEP